MEWKDGTPQRGDLIRTKVRFYYHYGIFLQEDTVVQFGLPDDPGRPAEEIRVLTSDVYTFLHGGELEVGVPSREEKKRMRPREEIAQTALSRVGEGGYDILHRNCEHFANECAFGEGHSSFVDGVRERIRLQLQKRKGN